MIRIDIPGDTAILLRHLVLDVNGTIAVDGQLLPGIAQRLAALEGQLQVHLLTANSHGRQAQIDQALGLVATILPPATPSASQGSLKALFVEELGSANVVAIGNGNNDAEMLRSARLGIAILGPEGLAIEALTAAGVLCVTAVDALDLLLNPSRLRATLRL